MVVGGGPTGVEFAGTLSDFVREDLRKKYPALMKYVKVTLLQVRGGEAHVTRATWNLSRYRLSSPLTP